MKCMGKVDVKTCKAECCGLVPIDKDIVVKHMKKMRRGSRLIAEENNVQIWVKDGHCAFLGKSYKCLIYEDRPEVCRLLGSGEKDNPMLKCHYLGQIDPKELEIQAHNIMERGHNY